MSKYRTCLSCGKEYVYCPHCGNEDFLAAWKILFDCEECMDVFQVVSDYNSGSLTEQDAQKALEKYPALNTERFRKEISNALQKITGFKQPKEYRQQADNKAKNVPHKR